MMTDETKSRVYYYVLIFCVAVLLGQAIQVAGLHPITKLVVMFAVGFELPRWLRGLGLKP